MALSLLILAVLAVDISARPGGAPASQCGSFLPAHGGAVQPGANPYEINLNAFPYAAGSSSVRTFECGMTYAGIHNCV